MPSKVLHPLALISILINLADVFDACGAFQAGSFSLTFSETCIAAEAAATVGSGKAVE